MNKQKERKPIILTKRYRKKYMSRDGGDLNKGHKKRTWRSTICSKCGHPRKVALHGDCQCPKCGFAPLDFYPIELPKEDTQP